MAFPKIEGYVVTEKLGSGSYSTVYKACTKVGARSIVAIKCVDKSRVKHSGSAIDNLITEIRLLKTLTHPHIVHMKQFTWDDRNIYIIMEYCCGGDLSKYIHRYGRVPEKQVLYFLQQLASALKFLREKGVVHMDLKPHNLLLHKDSNGKYILKVADFGFAQHMAEETKQCVRGSPLYMAPEMLCGEYDARVDLWSVGVIMYECLFGKAPYSSSTFKELVDKIQKQAPIEIPPNSSISPGCLDLLTRLLQHDPNKRISYEEFFSHPYLDLDHMPSKENYEKAVALIKQAIELDSMGHLRRALAAYRDGLLYLVPAVSRETDKLRRAALTGKLTRYMERAEEIKKFLKSQESNMADLPQDPHEDIHRISHDIAVQPPVNNRPVARRVPACCAGNQSVGSREFTQYRQADCNPCVCTIQSESVSTVNGHRASQPAGSAEVNGVEELPVESGSTSHPEPVSASEPKTKDSSPSRFTFRRFFGRNNSMPYLEAKDSSIIADDSKKQKSEDSSGDVCRIT